jgi:glyoxylase I family protein
MSRVLGLHHVSFVVRDTARSLAFYRDLLGLEVDPGRPDLGYPGAWLRCGDQQIHLLELPNVDPVEGRPAHVGRDRHAAFRVEDIDAFERLLNDAGVSFTRSRSGRRAIFCRDPDGNGLELIQNPGSDPSFG